MVSELETGPLGGKSTMQQKQKTAHAESGFTLIEILMAVALFVFGLMAYGVFSGNLVNKNARSDNRTQAVTLAQDKIEEIRRDAADGTPVAAIAGAVTTSDKFTLTTTLSPGGVNALSTITVVVSWGINESITVQTLLSQ